MSASKPRNNLPLVFPLVKPSECCSSPETARPLRGEGLLASIRGPKRNDLGFTLIELLVVIGIIALMMFFAGPAVNAMKGSNSLTASAAELGSMLELARSHAMAKNTYVYVGMVGLDEMSVANTNQTGEGRIGAVVMASKIGTRPTLSGTSIKSDEITPVSRVSKLENVVIKNVEATTGGMDRPLGTNVLNQSDFTKIVWPPSGSAQLTFDKVIEFSPKGVARMATTSLLSGTDQLDARIEIPLQQFRGANANVAAVQIDGITGAVRTYRP